jgi:hypothetical protein
MIACCTPRTTTPPEVVADLPIIDAAAEHDPFGGNPRPPPQRDDAGKPKCGDEKHEGWGSSGGGCGATMKWRCGSTRYAIECNGGVKVDATCTCFENDKPSYEIHQRAGCGNPSAAIESCGFPTP